MDAAQIREHMDVVGSDGGHVGTVDKVEGSRIKLTRKDPAAQGQHHYLDLDGVASVEGRAVRLKSTAAQAMAGWGAEARGVEPGSSRSGP